MGDGATQALERALRALLGELAREQGLTEEVVICGVEPIDPRARFLYPEEERAVERAVHKRKAEFATARRLAHELFVRLGCDGVPLLPDARRLPRWPIQVVGSIAHSPRAAAVAVAPSDCVAALGIDLEEESPLTEAVAATVLAPREAERLRALPGDPLAWAKVAFCAKECAYKLWSPFLGRILEFEDVELALDPPRSRFRARLREPRPGLPVAAELEGGWARADGHLIAAALLARAAVDAAHPTSNAARAAGDARRDVQHPGAGEALDPTVEQRGVHRRAEDAG
jgi:4'-phosphopantetheinyl transferase EntD